jgi:hypothetical protein
METCSRSAQARWREIANELGFPSGEDIDLTVWLDSLAAAASREVGYGDDSFFERSANGSFERRTRRPCVICQRHD